MDDHQKEIFRYKNELNTQININAQLKDEIQKNESNAQKIIRDLNQEINALTEKLNNAIIKQKEADKNKKVFEMKVRELEDESLKLK